MLVCMIDNYDSFTWNLYEYISQQGAQVEVFRNDTITIDELAKLNPDRIVISPGPGHPTTDSGISCDVIRHFAGKIPIFGVCMGQQCMYTVFGGDVGFAGEIVHGKTSTITHDNRGVFKDLAQDIAVTRYHSLAGNPTYVPDELEVTARSDNGIIMGVRHKKYTVEGVQFHPESILTESGHQMIKNFLNVEGGTWDKTQSAKEQSILDRIYAQRQKDVAELEQIPGKSIEDLRKSIEVGLAPKQIDFVERLKAGSHKIALMAEIKRASPSKGPIAMHIHAPSQVRTYAESGAATISVLTEPHWFKGSIEDLRLARLAVDSVENRPAILRKEFVFSEYQIYEARLAGADTVLLIVKMLNDDLLKQLYDCSVLLGMEPLVEVADADEMTRALKLGAKVIGVNNRDLHSFNVDMNTTTSLEAMVPEGTILAALSGISSKKDVEVYAKGKVNAILVGEALMRAKDTKAFIAELIN
ncbi:hypothetical protein TRVA0_033S00518 [Trichomonascus vanleenenianus]|uniref:bifunctional anthranilate synthase/indole-3-glycerol-phosphate synthase n=1 Tax=Trichomonascus vanleenenianus TaxID=2268995 RepID=UPI003ECA0A9A